MNYIFLALLLSTVNAKEVTEYTCEINKDVTAEISLLDAKNPSVSLVNKNSKAALCFFETLPGSKLMDATAVSPDGQWRLKLKKCDFYSDKIKADFTPSESITFKQAPGKRPSYLRLFTNEQPLICKPKA